MHVTVAVNRESSNRKPARRIPLEVVPVGIFLAVVLAYFGALTNDWLAVNFFDRWTGLVAQSTAGLFRLAGQDSQALGQVLLLNGKPVTIATGCNGAEAFGLYLAAVLALRAGWRPMLLGLGIGLLGIIVVNQIRILGLILVATRWPQFLFEAHNYIGQTVVIVAGAALWLFWVERYAVIRRKAPGPVLP